MFRSILSVGIVLQAGAKEHVQGIHEGLMPGTVVASITTSPFRATSAAQPEAKGAQGVPSIIISRSMAGGVPVILDITTAAYHTSDSKDKVRPPPQAHFVASCACASHRCHCCKLCWLFATPRCSSHCLKGSPIARGRGCGAAGGSSGRSVVEELGGIMAESGAGMKQEGEGAGAPLGQEGRARWWRRRLALDRRLSDLLLHLDTSWLGPWRCSPHFAAPTLPDA